MNLVYLKIYHTCSLEHGYNNIATVDNTISFPFREKNFKHEISVGFIKLMHGKEVAC